MQYVNKANTAETKPKSSRQPKARNSIKPAANMQYKPRATEKKMFSDLATYQPKKTTDSTCSSSPSSNDNISSPETQKSITVLSTSFNDQHISNPEELDSSFFGNDEELAQSQEKKYKSLVLIENDDLEGCNSNTNDVS